MGEQRRPFLTAWWRDLVLVTYRIPADLLHAYLPAGLEPDRRASDPEGTAYVSLVAFFFEQTRVRGVSVPLHTDFPEVNLRAYVREREAPHRRGVVFIRELVPRMAIAAMANLLYHENYRAMPLRCEATDVAPDLRRLRCVIELGEREHVLELTGRRPPVDVPEGSDEHFFKEHTWGFGRGPDGERVTYAVEHPVWKVYPCTLDDLRLNVSFYELYGAPWDALDAQQPCHVAYAVGSGVKVFPKDA